MYWHLGSLTFKLVCLLFWQSQLWYWQRHRFKDRDADFLFPYDMAALLDGLPSNQAFLGTRTWDGGSLRDHMKSPRPWKDRWWASNRNQVNLQISSLDLSTNSSPAAFCEDFVACMSGREKTRYDKDWSVKDEALNVPQIASVRIRLGGVSILTLLERNTETLPCTQVQIENMRNLRIATRNFR